MYSYNPSKQNSGYILALFCLLIIAYAVLGQMLIWNIPYTYPFGGPDEPMHLSMANYIANHLSWPQWDSTEVARNAYGVSYSPGGSIVYWLHGLSYRLFGYHRLGAYALLIVYLLLTALAYRRDRIAGFLLLAALLPQTLFTFSYINSDTGTIIAALLFGMSVGRFIVGEESQRNFLQLLFFAGLTITAKLHLWAIAFLTLVWALIYKRKTLLGYPKKIWMLAILVGLIPSSWWFITSYIANDGDFLGIFTSAKAIAKFGADNLPSLARGWESFSMVNFINSTLVSLYANWGWMIASLDNYYHYISVLVVTTLIIITLYRYIGGPIFFFFVLLVAANLGFMVVYSTFYDYQAQGRYLFPSIYIIVGIIAVILMDKKVTSKLLLGLLILINLQNIYYSSKLTLNNYLEIFLEKPVDHQLSSNESYPHAQFYLDQLQIINGKLYFRGWGFDQKNNRIFAHPALLLRGEKNSYKIPLEQVSRPDVADVFKNSALTDAGFSAKKIDLSELENDLYHYFLLITIDDKEMLVDIGKELKI